MVSILGQEKLLIARNLLANSFSSEILEIIHDKIRPRLTIKFLKGFVLYIRYNNFNEYTYQIVFSQRRLDRIRYDNFDDKWNVQSRPHHLHPRFTKSAKESPMSGNPSKDLPILIQVLKNLLK